VAAAPPGGATLAPGAPPGAAPSGAEAEVRALLAEVRRIEVQSRRLVVGALAGGYASVFRGAGLEFEAVREYAEGDDPRRVDWGVTARTGRPHVRTYAEERERTVVFLLDLSASMDGGFGVWSARRTAAQAIASIALSATGAGDKVGLVAVSDRVASYVPPRKGAAHALRIVRDALVRRAPPGRATALAPGLDFARRALRRRSVVFLVSDFLSGGWGTALARCARRHDVVAVRLLVPELAPPRDLLRLEDPETGAVSVFDGRSAAVRAAYAARVARWRGLADEAWRRARVDGLDVPVPRTPDPDAVVRPLLRFFRMRELRGTKR
jgi:uncharacterized protein (DUF58 family)